MKRIINTLLIMAVLVSVSSCTQEIPNNPIENGEADIVLHVRTPESFGGSETRSTLSLADENTIEYIHVLVFNSANNLVDIKEGTGLPDTPGAPTAPNYSGSAAFTATLTASASPSDADKFRLVVLANAKEIVEDNVGIGKVILGDPAYTKVIERLVGAIEDCETLQKAKLLPMWGETAHITVNEANKNQTVDLTRAVARIDVGVGAWDAASSSWKGLPNFELTSVFIAMVNKSYVVIPGATNRGIHPVRNTFLATNPTLTGGKFDIDDLKEFEYDATTSPIIRRIYVPEADIKMGGTKPGDTGHLERMAVIIGGKYNGDTNSTYYRVDFAKRVNNELELMNVLRNHLYRFDITSVAGPGHPKPEIAYRNMSMNINVNIVEWEVETDEIIIDGKYHIALKHSRNENRDDRTAILYREAGSTDVIEFTLSNNLNIDDLQMLDTGGWEIPTELEYADRIVVKNDRFMVEIKEDSNKRLYFEFTALEDFDTAAGSSTLTVIIPKSRINFEITIRQINADPNDWIGGPGVDVEVGG
jgi:hypothetical protein